MCILKKMGVILVAFVMSAAVSACGSKVTISANNAGGTGGNQAPKKYIIATNTEFAPFEFQNERGNYVGIDIDLLDAISKDQEFEYELVHLTFNDMLQALAAGEVDAAMGGISITEERREYYDYSEPYLEGGIVLAVPATRSDIKSFQDLKGKRVAVAVALGTQAEAYARSIQEKYDFDIVTFNEFYEVYKDVLDGSSQALLEDYPVVGYLISQGMELKIISDIEEKTPYGFAVPKGRNPELLDMFNNGLNNLKENGTYKKIIDTYIHDDR